MKRLAYILLPLALLSLWYFWPEERAVPEGVFGSDSGALSPGTLADDDTVGTVAWTNPSNAGASDNVYATNQLSTPQIGHYLKATNFGFTIPAGATIDGILVEIERHKTAGPFDNIHDKTVKIVKADGTIGTTNKAIVGEWPATLNTYYSYGSSSDLWDETWTSTDINDLDFGVVLSIEESTGDSVGNVDHIRITVYYTEAGASKAQVRSGVLNVQSGVIQIK